MEDLIDKVKKSDTFQVPDGYFDSLPEHVMQRIEAEEKVAQALEKYHAGDSFSAPDGYFAALPDHVMDRIRAAESRRFLFRRRLITGISIAASFVLVFGIGLLWNNLQNNGTPAENLTAENVQPQEEVPAAAQSNLPEDALAQVPSPIQSTSAPSPSKRATTQSKNELLEKKADLIHQEIFSRKLRCAFSANLCSN